VSGEHGVRGRAQVRTGHGRFAVGPAAVELAAIRETAVAIEQVELRRARGAKRFRDFLRFVVQIGIGEAAFAREPGHFGGGIGGMARHVVRADRHRRQALALIFGRELREAVQEVLDVRAVVANEGHEQRGRGCELLQAVHFAGTIGQRERRRRCAQLQHGRLFHRSAPLRPPLTW
jgi:hypothetical protein